MNKIMGEVVIIKYKTEKADVNQKQKNEKCGLRR